MAATVAQGSVLLDVKFDNIETSISTQLSEALSGASSQGTKAGSDTGTSFSTSLATKAGVISGVVSSVVSAAGSAISNGLSSAVSRVDTLNNFPKVMQNLGYSSDEASASIDKIQKSLQGLPSSTNDVASVVQTLAPMCDSLDEATTLGLSLNDMMLASGASTSDVNRAMTQYTQMLSKGSVDLQSWRTLQEVMPGQLDQLAQSLLGAGASSTDLYSALQDGTLSMDDFNNAVMELDQNGGDGFASFSQQAKDATQGIGTAMDNVQNSISRNLANIIQAIGASDISGAINTFSSSFDGIGDAIVTVIEGAKTVIGGAIDGIVGMFETLKAALPDGFFDGIVQAFQTIAPAIVPAVAAFGLLLPVVGTISKITSSVSALGTVLTTLAGGSMGIVVAAIAALVVGLAALYNNNETVRNAINAAWTQIQTVAATVWPAVSDFISTAVTKIQTIISTVWPIIQSVFARGMTVIQTIVSTVWPVIQTVFTTAMTAIQTAVQTVWPVIQTVITTAMTAIQTIVQTVWPIIQTVVTTVWTVIQTVVTTAMTVIQTIISTVMAAINGDWTGVWNGIQTLVSTVWNGIQSIVSTVINSVLSIITSILSSIKSVWDTCWNGIKSAFKTIWNGIKNGAKNGIDNVYNVVTGIKDKITGFFSGAGQWLVDSGKAILQGLQSGIESAIGTVTSAVSGAVESIRNLFPFSPAKTGPFSGHGYTTYSGKALITDWGKSILKNSGTAARLASRAVEHVYNAMDGGSLEFAASSRLNSSAAYTARAYAAMETSGLADVVSAYNQHETAVYVDGKKLASTIAKPMNQQLGRLAVRGA